MSDSPDLLTRLINNLPGMAYRCLHDADWTLEFVSDGCIELLGYTPRELSSERKVAVSDLIHPDDLAKVSLEVETALSERRPFSMVYRMRTASGEEKQIAELGRGIFAPDGSLEALEGFLSDVTAQTQAEAALRAVQRRETLGRLAGGIAHDFNNLLTTLYGATDLLLLDASDDDPKSRLIQSIVRVADKANELTQQLLHLGKPSPPTQQRVDLGKLLASQRTLLADLVGDSITTEITSTTEPILVTIDPGQFERIVLNLVGNARDAIDGDGTIHVDLTQSDGYAQLEVRDDGTGMTPEVQRQVFDPFFTTKVPERGTGLGLTVVQDAVRDAGGHIEIDSEPGNGTTFRVLLPLSQQTLPTNLPHDRPIGSEVVLLVDDEAEVRLLLARGLRRFGYTVLEAGNGQQALSLSKRHKGPIELLVTDGNMPGIGGIELAETLQRTRPESIRVLITGDSVVPPDGLFRAVLRKPIRLQSFAEQLRELLSD